MVSLIIISNWNFEFFFFFQSTITFFNGKRIYFVSKVNMNVRFELLQKAVKYEKDTA